jgi:hypothetical protein
MRTEKQIEASRRNGAKSRGPVTPEGKRISAANSACSTGPRTPEGKARSSRNATKDERFANSVTFPAESKTEFLDLLERYRTSLQPVGFLEERVVENITVADWYRRRYWALGMARVAHASILQEHTADKFTSELNREIPAVNTALAVSNLVDNGRSLEYFRRCDSGYSREYRRARAELNELQTARLRHESDTTIEQTDPDPTWTVSDDEAANLASLFQTEPSPSDADEEKIYEQTEPDLDSQPAPTETIHSHARNAGDLVAGSLPGSFSTCYDQSTRPLAPAQQPPSFPVESDEFLPAA